MKCDFDKIPKSTIYREAEEEAMQKWQRERTRSHNAAATRQYFPTIQHRVGSKIKLTPQSDSSAYGPWDDEGILARVSSDRRSNMQLRGRIPINGPPPVPLSKPKRTTGCH
jgi:hypothetical protein